MPEKATLKCRSSKGCDQTVTIEKGATRLPGGWSVKEKNGVKIVLCPRHVV